MAKEEIRYSDIFVQALTNKIPCIYSGLIHSSFKQVFSLYMDSLVLQMSASTMSHCKKQMLALP